MTSIVRRPVAVVEDDASVRQSLLRLLHSSGRAAVAYASAEEFLLYLLRDKPCCLVLDIHLRGMSGVDLLEKLARENVSIPVVFITANGEEAPEGVLRQSGATCLRKPFDETSLIQAIDAAIGGELPSASAGPA
jgi:FixJ family two-component response regulator